jgi:hypothetical protein
MIALDIQRDITSDKIQGQHGNESTSRHIFGFARRRKGDIPANLQLQTLAYM